MIAKRILLAVTAILAVAAIAMSTGIGGNTFIAWAQDIPPPPAPGQPFLGNPTNLTATTGGRGEVNIHFNPAVGATVHWIWRVKPGYTGGAWVKGEADGQQTVTGLTPGQAYYFVVIAGRPFPLSAHVEPEPPLWSSWSNWSGAVAGTVGTSTPSTPSAPTFPANPVNGDYDADDDGLIEIRTIAQLDAMRYDLDGDGVADANSDDDDVNAAAATAYADVFPGPAAGMGCPDAGCAGYELANNLDFHTAGSIIWEPVGNSESYYAYFTADFDGNHRTISNLVIHSSLDDVGFFGVVGSGGKVRRVGLEAVSVVSGSFVGGLVGWNLGSISDSYVKGSVSGGGDSVGGLVGYNNGVVTKSYADASVYGSGNDSDDIGGLVGNNYGSISNSYAEGSVSGDDAIGGLVGNNHNNGVIAASYATAAVSGDWSLGGLVGYNAGNITATYATGTVSGGAYRGGLVGQNAGSIATAYATGTVYGDYNAGGLVGYNPSGHVNFSYWDTETSGWTTSGGGGGVVGLNTAQLQTPTSNTGIYARWNSNQWDFGTSSQYPVLKVAGLSVASQRGQATAGQPGAGNAADRAALVAFYEATGGNNNQWLMTDGWLSDAPLGQWYGVTTNADGRVTALELDYNTLTGAIPAELGSLDQLTILRMGSNDLTGPIPAELGNLSNLSILGLGNNQLTGSIPAELGNLSGLTRVSMWNNRLSGPIPSELGNLSRLTKLSLGSNQLSGSIPSSLGNLSNLESLGLQRNQLSGAIPAALGGLSNLTWLDFDFNQLSGSIPAELGNLSNLTVLRLGSNQLSGSIPPALGNLSNLSILGLGNNQLTGSIPPQLGNLASLTRFSLWNNQITGAIPAELGNLSNLNRLSLGSNQLNGPIPSQLGNLARLQHLYLQGNQLTGEIPSQLGSLSNLNNLDLSSNRLSGGVPTALGNLAGLKLLRLSNNQLTGAIPSQLGNLSSLTRLYLYENQLSGTIPAELGRLSKLQVLDLSHNRISGAIPGALFSSSTTAGSSFRGNGAMSAETAFATNIVYFDNPDLRLSQEIRPQPAFLASLRVLNLSYNQLSGVVPPGFLQLATLQRAYFHENQDLDPRPGHKTTASGQEVLCTAGMEAEGSDNDLDALAKLYELTDGRGVFSLFTGPQWNEHEGWEDYFKKRPAKPLAQWYGVKTNGAGRVVELNLNGNNLQENNGVTHWAKHLREQLNKSAWGCKYPLFWLEKLDLGNNQLDGDIGKLLSDLHLQSGGTLTVDLSGENNTWDPDHFVTDNDTKVEYKNIVEVTVPDLSAVADGLLEEDETLSVATTEIANLGLKVLSTTAKSSGGMMIGRIGSTIGSRVGFINAVTHHEAVTAVVVGIVLGRENEELQRTFLDLIGIKSGPVRDRITHGCISGQEWDGIKGECVWSACKGVVPIPPFCPRD